MILKHNVVNVLKLNSVQLGDARYCMRFYLRLNKHNLIYTRGVPIFILSKTSLTY